jgi:hypothetical protein
MAQPSEVTVTIRDASGDKATASFFVQNNFTFSQYNEMSADLANALDAVIGGVIENMSLRIPVDVSGLTGNTIGSTADVGDVGQFQFRSTENRPVKINVPGILEAVVAGGSDDLNQADAAVAALIAGMEDGLTTVAGVIQPCNIGEDDIVTTEFARERFRNRGARN